MKFELKKIELKKFDYIIIATIATILLLGVILFAGKAKIAKTPVLSEDTVVFDVFFRGITITSSSNPFVPSEESFITIRNVPHKNVTIVGTKIMPKMTVVGLPNGKTTVARDVSSPFMYDCFISVVDDAKITEDGVVLGGNKLKIGLPIIMEGKNYRFNGTVANINVLSKEEAVEMKAAIAQEKDSRARTKINPINLPKGLKPEQRNSNYQGEAINDSANYINY